MAQKLPTQRSLRVTEVRNHLGSILNRVLHGEEHLVIEKLGVPVAAIISMTDYEQYRRYRAQELHTQLGRKLGAEAIKQGLTEEALIASMEDARQAVYDDMYGANGKSDREAETK
ncbi:MAG TPA: type II toxin-antitoxin system Phd/YefM family antitoxin [Chloroflexia bacterium]|nr:type II toxin-antitoxin system Phd/YefM family antitoxin [Chloroflexia bacterium]